MYAQLTLTHTPAEAARLTKALMTVLFNAGYGWLLWRRSRDRVQVLETSALGIFGLLLLMSWWFLPWYILWALPLAALSVGRPIGRIGLVLSCTALLSYAPIAWGRLLWYVDPTFELELSRVLLIWTVPLLLFLVELLRPLRGPRMIAVQTALRGWNTGEVSGRRVRPLRNAR
jgi:cobalamin synthase